MTRDERLAQLLYKAEVFKKLNTEFIGKLAKAYSERFRGLLSETERLSMETTYRIAIGDALNNLPEIEEGEKQIMDIACIKCNGRGFHTDGGIECDDCNGTGYIDNPLRVKK